MPAWSDAHLRSGAEMAARFAPLARGAVEAAARLGDELSFSLHLGRPHNCRPGPVPPGHTEMSYLRQLTYEGALERFGPPEEAREKYLKRGHKDPYKVLERELKIIEEQKFPGYFLVVWDIVRFLHEHDILCQGRGFRG